MGRLRLWHGFAPALVLAASQASAQSAAMANMDTPPIPHAPVHVTVDSESHHVIVTTGPWNLPPMMMDGDMPMMMDGMGGGHESHQELLLVKFPWPHDMWLRGFKLTITDKNGHVMPQRTMHHMEFVNFDRRQLVYPMAERVLGIGEETAAIKLPRTVGVPMDSGQQVGVFLMWNNDTGHELDGINLRFELITAPRNLMPRPVAVLPFKVDVNNTPGLPDSYEVPPGGLSKSYEFVVPVSGRLLGVGGHMHDHGVEMRLEDVRTGKVLARVHTLHDSTGAVIGVSRQLLAVKGRGPHLHAGRSYRLVAVYENKTNAPIMGVMGVMGGLFAPDDLRDWPKVDHNNKEYQLDIALGPMLERSGLTMAPVEHTFGLE
ncbi:MAG TPA: hypothetical protein VGL65_13705 [Gemmatimonadales bacterium]|jgi:hypothetical protein